MGLKSPISLCNFFIFNPTLGQIEGEEYKKILYYYPKETDLNTQTRIVGLSEGFVTFTKTFNPTKSCEVVHTKRTSQFYLEAESDYWMILTISIPLVEKTKENHVINEYQNEDVQDNVYEAVLKQLYQTLRFLIGPFEYIMKISTSMDQVKEILENFFTWYLPTLRLQESDIMDIFQGINFFPVDKITFLNIQYFINQLNSQFTSIKYAAFLYNNQLIWSGLEQENTQILYKYITKILFPTIAESNEKNNDISTSLLHTNRILPRSGKIVLGSSNVNDFNLDKTQRIFINVEDKCKEYYLVVYRALSATVCLLIDISTSLNVDFLKNLDEVLNIPLSTLAIEIDDLCNKIARKKCSSSRMWNFKYIYFNHMNMAQKFVNLDSMKKSDNVTIPCDIMKIISDLSFDLKRFSKSGEVILRTMSDVYIVGRHSDEREFYVIVQRKSSLLEISGLINDIVRQYERIQCDHSNIRNN